MVDIAAIAEAVGSSGILLIVWNFWSGHRAEKASAKAEARIEKREPLVLENLSLGASQKLIQMMQATIDELVEAKQRQAEDFYKIHVSLEANVTNLTQRNSELTKQLEELSGQQKQTP